MPLRLFLRAAFAVVLALSCAAPSLAAPAVKGGQDQRPADESTTFGYPYSPARNFKSSAINLFDRQNGWTAAIALTSVIAAKSSFDDDAQEYFNKKRRLGDIHALGNDILGTGIPGVLLGAGLWITGDLMGRTYETHAGQASIEALFATGIITAAMKGSFQRRRPDGSDPFSFPSGHTSTVFASAMVLQEFYGWKAGVPAFLLGALTAGSRMQENRHWLSDTVAGASLGILIGHAISRTHLDLLNSDTAKREPKVSFMPVIERDGGRLLMRIAL